MSIYAMVMTNDILYYTEIHTITVCNKRENEVFFCFV